jgi:hypothetical protein
LRDAVVSGCDAPKLLELPDGPFDTVSEAVFDRIKGTLAGHAGALRDDRLRAVGFDKIENRVGIVSLVSEDMTCRQASQERDAKLWIAGIAASQDEPDRATKGVDRDVPL